METEWSTGEKSILARYRLDINEELRDRVECDCWVSQALSVEVESNNTRCIVHNYDGKSDLVYKISLTGTRVSYEKY